MKSAVTVSAVEQARGGPFVLWDTFPNACELAKRIGFDGIEVFAPSADYFNDATFKSSLDANELEFAAAGTGSGWVVYRLTLSSPDKSQRAQAIDFVKSIIDAVAPWRTRVIIGSMQGRADKADDIPELRKYLAESLNHLAAHAASSGVTLLMEPLNRYETNLLNTVEDGLKLIHAADHSNIKLLCDIFHMNIEEASITKALREAGEKLGHVHFADSNRWAVGYGHLEYAPIINTLLDLKYKGYLSAEVFAKPDSENAAKQSHLAFQSLCGEHSDDTLTG